MAISTTADSEITPQERLAISRKAIVWHMQRRVAPKKIQDVEGQELGDSPDLVNSDDGKWDVFKRAARAWWLHHPANVALDVAMPLVGQYAQRHPFRVLGIAASAGAAFIWIKPWRLMSVGSVILAAMKPSDISGVVLSMLTPSSQDAINQQGNE